MKNDVIYIKNKKKTLFWGWFWRYGIIIIILINFIFVPVLINWLSLSKEIENIILGIGLGIGPIIMGTDYILAIIFKWNHILLVDQSACHIKMTTENLRWSDIDKKEFIFIGCIFLALGLGLMILGFFANN